MDRNLDPNILTLFFTHIINDSNIVILSTVLPQVVGEFKLTYLESGVLVNAVFISMILLQTIFGHLSSNIKAGPILGIGMLTLGIGGLITVQSHNYPTLIIGQLIMGIGASFYHPIAYGLTENLYGEVRRGRAFGIVTSAGDIGVLAVFITSGILSIYYDWRTPITIFSILAIASGITSIKILKVKSIKETSRRIQRRINIKKIGIILAIYITVVSINRITYSYIPLILSKWLTSQAIINLFISALIISGITGELLSGIIIDKYMLTPYTILISILMMISPITLLQLNGTIYTLIPLTILGYVMYSYMPIIYGPMLGGSIVNRHGTIYGLTVSLGMIGGFSTSILAGYIADAYGLNNVPILMASIALITLITYLTYLKYD